MPLPGGGVQNLIYSGLADLQRAPPHIGTIEAVLVCIACTRVLLVDFLGTVFVVPFSYGEGEGFDTHPRQLQLQRQL